MIENDGATPTANPDDAPRPSIWLRELPFIVLSAWLFVVDSLLVSDSLTVSDSLVVVACDDPQLSAVPCDDELDRVTPVDCDVAWDVVSDELLVSDCDVPLEAIQPEESASPLDQVCP